MRKLLGFFALGALATASAWAGTVTGVTTLAALSSNDSVSWGQLGLAFTTVSSPASVTSANGLSMTVSDGGTLERRDQGSGWAGNFTNFDQLLWNQDNGNPITVVDLSAPIGGAGAQIQSDVYGSFTATISAYNGSTLLGSFTENGVSTGAGDGSAIFIGLVDTSAEITSVGFSVSDANGLNNFAIDTLYLNDSSTTSTPEPASLLLAGSALMGLSLFSRKRRKI
jgi:hypothetical protein